MLTLIAAIAENTCIGKNNTLPWYIPEDLKHFKELTTGKTVLMGRKTFESVLARINKPLPNRLNVVVTKQTNFTAPEGVEIFSSIEEALKNHANDDVYVAGGAEVYAETISRADHLNITHIHQIIDGDAFFPLIDPTVWKETTREDHEGFSFVRYIRK